jgi:hypothetical protein
MTTFKEAVIASKIKQRPKFQFELHDTSVHVKMGRKQVGDIKRNKDTGRYFYQSKGSKPNGEEFDTVAALKRWLEAELK